MNAEFDLAEPRAAALIEALRAVGYSLESAIADLVDNSITAGARNVWVRFAWNGAASSIAILDDGLGMTDGELFDAMRPGSRNPLDVRASGDLGRFGLGLKTASFSQCRRLTVASRRADAISTRCWDLDYVGRTGEWRLLRDINEDARPHLETLRDLKSGTLVLWQILDRIVGGVSPNDRHAHDRFLTLVGVVKAHLEMVFHRFLDGPRPRLRIWINGSQDRHALKAWDPFLENHPATATISDEERLQCAGAIVTVKGFVLPHKDRLGDAELVAAGGPRGWHAQQGFYVYRNMRMLVSGGWLGLDKLASEEHFKLARLRIDIPSTLDGEWAIDVKKSRARPPGKLRPRLRELALAVRSRARAVYVHRGRISVGSASEPLRRAWISTTTNGRLSYRIDRQNPVVRLALFHATSAEQRANLEALLKLLEATVPIQQIWLDAMEQPDARPSALEGEDDTHVREVMLAMFRALRADGVSSEVAKQRIGGLMPSHASPDFLETLDEEEA